MRKSLLILLGLVLIFLLSYYCFKTKAVVIENHLLLSVEEKYTEASLEEITVSVKGEDFNKTRILILRGKVNSIEEKESATTMAQNIKGVYAVENYLEIKESPIVIDTNTSTPIPKELLLEKELTLKDEAVTPEIITPNTPKLTILEVESEKAKPIEESLVSSTGIVLIDRQPSPQLQETVKEISTTCEENLREKLTKEQIHFEYGKALIKEDSYTLLNALVEILKTCSEDIVYIEGHSDAKGSKKYNQWLSQKRANAVKAYFVKHGIKKTNLKALGYGETHPIATNKTVAGQKLNRRIEFKIKGVK